MKSSYLAILLLPLLTHDLTAVLDARFEPGSSSPSPLPCVTPPTTAHERYRPEQRFKPNPQFFFNLLSATCAEGMVAESKLYYGVMRDMGFDPTNNTLQNMLDMYIRVSLHTLQSAGHVRSAESRCDRWREEGVVHVFRLFIV